MRRIAKMPLWAESRIHGDVYVRFGGRLSETYHRKVAWRRQPSLRVPFEFRRGASTDFPGASLLIGEKVYYTHWTPAKAHVSHLQVSSPAAIDAEIAEAKNALKSGAELFIGGHGGAAKADAVQFKIDYLNTMKKLLAENKTAETFIGAMKKAYPELPGADGLGELAKALYK